ncbi:MAG TPA: ketose-bisphosphate aldolase [Candidatus Enterousia intestinigallinarum]|uniref:Ketose-bisphosphate aldolase n=1 Tax=Candidatus Enterousia intestinigallinarum TaxID=2840790 RepID=A0A9D1JWE0_9PROT|nr:ketose-bisphosphate aldolase [Candidatus Enterousia intestinigallinarum]
MDYKDFGLVNTKNMFSDALARHYAVPAFNFYNMETLSAIIDAARDTHSPVILAVSESALKYMSDNLLRGMIWGLNLHDDDAVALHLDHGSSFDACVHAIEIGFSSVMIDGSKLPFDANVDLARTVAEYAHKYDVTVEAELGVLSGIEDENTHSTTSSYTNPNDVVNFVNATNIDSLAIAIGTSHGAYKRKSDDEELRFDILDAVARQLPDFPLVLHGASSIPTHFVKTINEFGGKMSNARGIAPAQLRRAVEKNICKINVDSDSRLAFTAGVREVLATKPENFNPRDYLGAGRKNIYDNCVDEIKNIMGSNEKTK